MITIGVISDTHGLLRAEAVTALQGVDHIVHAGDVGKPDVLAALAKIAPMTAVRGNVDCGPWSDVLPENATVTLVGATLFVVHDLKSLAFDAKAHGIQAVISGHTHRPLIETRDGVLYFNPGSAGPRRFSLPVSIGFLTVSDGGLVARTETIVIE